MEEEGEMAVDDWETVVEDGVDEGMLVRVGEGEIAVNDWETVVGDDWDTGGLAVEAEEGVGDSTIDCLDTKTCFDTSIRD